MYEVNFMRFVADEMHVMHFRFDSAEEATTFAAVALRHNDNAKMEILIQKEEGADD